MTRIGRLGQLSCGCATAPPNSIAMAAARPSAVRGRLILPSHFVYRGLRGGLVSSYQALATRDLMLRASPRIRGPHSRSICSAENRNDGIPQLTERQSPDRV